ncbi:GNAT family N-acetyltransferase [Owenweeksia hongkongensis]|uniref:GNAT family N-acetyltransferase n=1 Tax=Owenweeksia hongkongensis TaxID=253245 RepID=UPI003A910398
MLNIKFIKHKSITEEELDDVITVKSSAWPYPRFSQLNWIKTNLKDEDIHLLIKKNELPVAYLNLISIDLEIDKEKIRSYGLGNVCVLKKGEGMGKTLMYLVNDLIKKEKKIGLLFCKKSLIKFYNQFGWEHVEKNKLKSSFDDKDIETMVYNSNRFLEIEYKANIF